MYEKSIKKYIKKVLKNMRKSIKKCEKSIKKRVKKILWKNNCGNLPVKNRTVGKYVKILLIGSVKSI